MKGLAHTLLSDLQGRFTQQPFRLAAAILRARVVPRHITPDVDDPAIERRLLAELSSAAADGIASPGWSGASLAGSS
jgi:hypothetical protein